MSKRAFPIPAPAALPTKARRRSGALSELAASWKAPNSAPAAPHAPAAKAAPLALSSKRVSAADTAQKHDAAVKEHSEGSVESGDEEEEDMEWDGVIPDDHDRDSVDSDTSGTISEDLDLNKANDSDDDEEDGDSSSDDEDGDEKTITVDFDFKDPAPIDFLSVRNLLTRYLPAAETSHDADDTPAAASAPADDTKEVTAASDSSADSSGSDDDSDDAGKATAATAGSAKRAKKSQADIISAFNPSDLADAYVNQVMLAGVHWSLIVCTHLTCAFGGIRWRWGPA